MDKTVKTSGAGNARSAIISAFSDIVLEGAYDRCRVLDIVARSGVARSTFYEHFQSRDDVLRDLLRFPFGILAQLATPGCDLARMALMLEHVAENRALLKSLTANPGLETLIAVFSDVLESSAGLAPYRARALAGAYMAVLTEWLSGSDRRSAADLAAFMRELALRIASL